VPSVYADTRQMLFLVCSHLGVLAPLLKPVTDRLEAKRRVDLEGMACGTSPILVMA
jgi:hypothetical protein